MSALLRPASKVRGRGRWRPTFDIDCKRTDGVEDEREAVLRETLDALVEFFGKEYGVALTFADIVVLDACIASKISFHLMLAEWFVEGDYSGFKRRLAAARAVDPRLRRGEDGRDGVDLAIYSKTQVFRQAGSSKRGKSNALEPLDVLEDMTFFPSSRLLPHEHLSTWTAAATHRPLQPVTPDPPAPPKSQRRKAKKDQPKEDSEYIDEDEDPPADDMVEGCCKLLRDAGDGESECCLARSTSGQLYFFTKGKRTCLASGLIHESNNFVVEINDLTREVQYVCLSVSQCGSRPLNCKRLGALPPPAAAGDGGLWEVPASREFAAGKTSEGHPCVPDEAMPESTPSVALRSPMGTGKGVIAASYAESYVAKNPDASVLYICPRVQLLREQHKEYYEKMEFKLYLDERSARIKGKRVVCSINSLWKLDLSCFDLIIWDEVNTSLRALQDMDRACAIHKRLMALLAGAKHVRLLDGHLDSLAKHTLDKAGLEAAVWSQVNHKTHPQRKVKLLFSKTDDEANRRLRADVECGKRVAVQCTSKADAQAVHIALSKTFPEHKIWLLTSETPDKEDWERKTFSRFKTFQKFL